MTRFSAVSRFGIARAGGFRITSPTRLRLVRLRRWFVSLALVVGGFVVIAATQSGTDADVENLWLPLALALVVCGATAGVWRRAEGGGFEALRWRRLHRRVFWRAATLSLLGGLAALWLVAFWEWRADTSLGGFELPTWDSDNGHAAFFRGVSAWLSAAAPALVLAEPFVWRLWPHSLRQAVRRAKTAEVLAKRRYGTQLILDPALGAAGRPEATLTVKRGEPSRRAHAITPQGRQPADWPRTAARDWWRHGRLAWDGSALEVTDGQLNSWRFPTVTTPSDADSEDARGTGHVAELVWFTEEVRSWRVPTWQHEQILLLDATGRRIAELPVAGLTAKATAEIAEAAGLPFAAYDLGSVRRDESPAHPLLFPRTRRTVKAMPLPRRTPTAQH